MTRRESPRSCTSESAAALLLLWLLALLVGRTEACTLSVYDYLNISLTLTAYDPQDITCANKYGTYTVAADQAVYVECGDPTACQVKLSFGSKSNSSSTGCDGAVYAACAYELSFHYDASGNIIYNTGNDDDSQVSGRALLESAAAAAAEPSSSSLGGIAADATPSSSGMEDEGVTTTSSTSLRGAMGSKRGPVSEELSS